MLTSRSNRAGSQKYLPQTVFTLRGSGGEVRSQLFRGLAGFPPSLHPPLLGSQTHPSKIFPIFPIFPMFPIYIYIYSLYSLYSIYSLYLDLYLGVWTYMLGVWTYIWVSGLIFGCQSCHWVLLLSLGVTLVIGCYSCHWVSVQSLGVCIVTGCLYSKSPGSQILPKSWFPQAGNFNPTLSRREISIPPC